MKLKRKQRKNIKRKRDNMLTKIQKGFYLDAYEWIRDTKENAEKKLRRIK